MTFSYLVYFITIIALIVSVIKDKNKTKKALLKAWRSFENILPQFLAILIIIGLVLAILTPQDINNILGANSGIIGIMIALVIGSITLIPGFVAFPLVVALLANGAGYGQIATFISALMMVGFVTMPLEKQIFGKKATFTRNLLAMLFSLVVGLIMGVIFK